MTVRVIRVLEYEYPDHETAERDMANWKVPPTGSWSVRAGRTIRSATTFPTLTDQVMSDDERCD